MELGEKLKQARLEAGLSQRALCGEEITRNMLSQIEHGTAKPSMSTLRYLAQRLEKPVSWFLDGQTEAHSSLIEAYDLLEKAGEAIRAGKEIYAEQLLNKVTASHPDIQRRRLLLMAKIPGRNPASIVTQLPSLDEELLLRAKAALESDGYDRAKTLLDAAEDRHSPEWNLLMGQLLLKTRDYAAAAACFHRAEEAYPMETAGNLEVCYRELGNYQQAYFYACKRK